VSFREQAWALLALMFMFMFMWGVNWPTMKLSLQETTPLMLRASTLLLGAGWLFFYVARKGKRVWPAGREWAGRWVEPPMASVAGAAGAAQLCHA